MLSLLLTAMLSGEGHKHVKPPKPDLPTVAAAQESAQKHGMNLADFEEPQVDHHDDGTWHFFYMHKLRYQDGHAVALFDDCFNVTVNQASREAEFSHCP